MHKDRQAEHKPLSFTTTLRNPERIAGFLACLKQFDGQILTDALIDKIVKALINQKLYSTMYITRTPHLKSISQNEDITFTDEQLDEIVRNSPQEHKEAGFDRGWPSRFDTWYKICKEFGFAYYDMNKPIKISQSGHMLCDAYEVTFADDVSNKIQNVFLNALAKYPSNNPFRRNANENVPLMLLMKVVRMLKNDTDENNAGLSRKEVPFVLCWPDNDADKLYRYIKSFRGEYGYKASDDTVYNRCLSLLGSNNQTRFKKVQITKEGPDDFLRKARITGVFTMRGLGRFVDLNELEHEKIDYMLENYGAYRAFADELEYYDFVGSMDPKIISIETDTTNYNIADIRQSKLIDIASKYSDEQIRTELELLTTNRKSSDLFFSDIDEPTRLEFLTSIALEQSLEDAHIQPNYAIDDEGNPTFTARGGIGDIEVYDKDNSSLFEVTLMRSKQQAVAEIPAITRHLGEIKNDSKFAVFIAPLLHADAKYMIGYTKAQYDLDIIGFTITEFCEKLKTTSKLRDFVAS